MFVKICLFFYSNSSGTTLKVNTINEQLVKSAIISLMKVSTETLGDNCIFRLLKKILYVQLF